MNSSQSSSIKDNLHPIEIMNPERSVKDISFILKNDSPDALLIMEQGKIIGIITDTDLVMKVKKEDLFTDNVKIKDIMSSPVISIESEKTISEAIDLMVKNDIQKLLVTQEGMPIGVLYGEDILDLDEKRWKELIFNQTIEEVYKITLQDENKDFETLYLEITNMDKFSNLDSKVEFDLYVYQEGLVLVAYNYIKENPNISLERIKLDIKKNYLDLLNRYSNE